ncbi:MAG: glycoside hydrolase, partial [Ignavibacteriaceae bacterium]|nr:glycoside hydrolase [Ignavibacteriaceae bacterium]
MKIRYTLAVITFFINSVFGQYQNVRVSNPGSTSPEEVTIAINPSNPEQLAAGANIKFFYYSNTGGLTWTEKTLSSSLGVWGDPCVIYDGLNNLYFAHLSNPIAGYWIDRIVVQRSTDNGVTWNDGAGIGYQYPKNQDKEWMAVDLSDTPYKNNLY